MTQHGRKGFGSRLYLPQGVQTCFFYEKVWGILQLRLTEIAYFCRKAMLKLATISQNLCRLHVAMYKAA